MFQKTNCHLIEVFRTEYGTVYQCNRYNHFVLDFGGRRTPFKIIHFLDFARLMNGINLTEMAQSTSRHADLAILMPHYTENCFVLTLHEVISLRELINGAKAMIQLNSIVSECLSQYA